jgi:hypothetical protein
MPGLLFGKLGCPALPGQKIGSSPDNRLTCSRKQQTSSDLIHDWKERTHHQENNFGNLNRQSSLNVSMSHNGTDVAFQVCLGCVWKNRRSEFGRQQVAVGA